jgi:hypothetical protein
VGNSVAHIFLNSVLNQLRSHSTAMSPIRLGSRNLFPGSLSRVLTLQLQAPRAGLAQLQQSATPTTIFSKIRISSKTLYTCQFTEQLSFQRFVSAKTSYICQFPGQLSFQRFEPHQRLCTLANYQDSSLFKDSNRIKDFVYLPISRTPFFFFTVLTRQFFHHREQHCSLHHTLLRAMQSTATQSYLLLHPPPAAPLTLKPFRNLLHKPSASSTQH